ncbi:MAG: hypothetical protein KAJ19_11475, partial [Gammaproteobacteria bacterium]|nr:hypothetical protein [Gammaproteobacteria bacterium]
MTREDLDTWTVLTSGPDARYFYSAEYLTGAGDDIFVFGGAVSGVLQGSLWKYSITGDSWSQITGATGTPPTARTGHTSDAYGDFMFIFGGSDIGGYKNDMFEYDSFGAIWSSKASGATARTEHSSIRYGDNIYIFGGYDGGYLADVYEYDISGNSWASKSTTGTVPSARRRHSAILFDGAMYVFGGDDGSLNNDVFRLDLSTFVWTELTTTGTGPSIRDYHTATELDGEMFITGGQGLKDTFKLDLSTLVWTQLTDDIAVRYGCDAVAFRSKSYSFGGVGGAGALTEYNMDYYIDNSSGYITTDNIDLGKVPTEEGEWMLHDIAPDGTTLVYTAWHSTTGAFTGEEVSIGVIADGDVITDLKRYWRVRATFTPNANRNRTPTLQAIRADYTTFRRFNKIPDLGYEPLVDSLDSLTTKIDLFKPSSVGQISVGIVMSSEVSNWVFGDTLYNKIVKVRLGFDYPGFTEGDYAKYFTGAIDDWDVSDGVLKLVLKDLSKDWSLPVPSKWETGDDVTWTDKHHVDVILNIFQNHINVRDSGLLLEFF